MTDMMYRLVLKAKFESEQELERVIHGLKQLEVQGAKVNISMGTTGREGAMGLDSLARSALRVGFMFNMLESAYMRVTMGQMMVQRGQEAYNKTVEKYGVHSEEAREATKRLELQQKYLNMANMRSNISMGLLLTQLALQSDLLKSATLSTIAHTVASKAATVAHHLETAAIWAKAHALTILHSLTPAGWAMLGISAVAGGTALASLAMQRTQASQYNIEVNINQETDLDEAFDEAKQRANEELRRQG